MVGVGRTECGLPLDIRIEGRMAYMVKACRPASYVGRAYGLPFFHVPMHFGRSHFGKHVRREAPILTLSQRERGKGVHTEASQHTVGIIPCVGADQCVCSLVPFPRGRGTEERETTSSRSTFFRCKAP